jgi:hypothetical protein
MASLPAPYRDPAVNVCWVVDGNHPMFDALTWVDQAMGDATTKVISVAGAVYACQSCAINNSRNVDFLTIFGHGTGGYQSIGAGQKFETSGTLSLHYQGVTPIGVSHLTGPAEAQISALNGVLSPNATVFLAGCSVGDGGQGDGLLTTVSMALNNRPVQAFENAVYWWTGVLVGFLKTAVGSSVSSSLSAYTL